MLSSALRFGTTEHIQPGPKSGITGWKEGNSPEATSHNIGLLAMREAQLVKERLPELGDLRYDNATQSFYDGNTRIPDEELQAYLRQRIGTLDRNFAHGVGDSTFRRALATLAAQGSGEGGIGGLVGTTSKAPPGLKRILYSKPTGGNSVDGSTAYPIAQDAINALRSQISNGPGIDVVRNINDLGAHYDEGTLASLKQDRPEAFYDPNQDKVVLVADHFAPEKGESLDHYVQRKVLHEAVGHGGLARLFSGKLASQYGDILSGLQRQLGNRDFGSAWSDRHGYRNLQELAKAYRFDLNTPEGIANTIEEHLARMAEEAKTPTWFDHTVAKITELLRAAGFNTWIEADTRVLLQKAHREVFAR